MATVETVKHSQYPADNTYILYLDANELELVSMGLLTGIAHSKTNLQDHPQPTDEERAEAERVEPVAFLGDLFKGTLDAYENLHQELVDQLGFEPANG